LAVFVVGGGGCGGLPLGFGLVLRVMGMRVGG